MENGCQSAEHDSRQVATQTSDTDVAIEVYVNENSTIMDDFVEQEHQKLPIEAEVSIGWKYNNKFITKFSILTCPPRFLLSSDNNCNIQDCVLILINQTLLSVILRTLYYVKFSQQILYHFFITNSLIYMYTIFLFVIVTY